MSMGTSVQSSMTIASSILFLTVCFNPCKGIPVFSRPEVELLEEIDVNIYKARSGDTVICVKTVLRSMEGSFLREVEMLFKSGKASNAIPFMARLNGIGRWET